MSHGSPHPLSYLQCAGNNFYVKCIRRPSTWTVRVQTFVIFAITLYLLFSFPGDHRRTHRARSAVTVRSKCSAESGVYINGRLTCDIRDNMKFLSYQPTRGGWNNQRFTFENAVVIAKLLNRTLVVHPIAPHQEILRVAHTWGTQDSYHMFNSITSENLLPLSQAIDLKYLSRLLPVKEITKNHQTFYETFRGLEFYNVCHNSFLGLWIDAYPPKEATVSWNIIRTYMKRHRYNVSDIPAYRRWCKSELDRYTNVIHGDRPVWGILDELANRSEDMIYFEEGSLYVRRILFLDKQRALAAHDWIMRYIRSAPELNARVQRVVRKIGYPFNAIHVRRTDHPSKRQVSQSTWLTQLKDRHALMVTQKLYVATDERNRTWFEPFVQAGYKLLFAEDFVDILQQRHLASEPVAQDVLGLHEQLICTHAFQFVGSYYSTFSRFIMRFRRQARWKGGLLKQELSPIVWAGDL